jgi:hypothetical protein
MTPISSDPKLDEALREDGPTFRSQLLALLFGWWFRRWR